MEYGVEITAVVVLVLRLAYKLHRRKKKKEQAINEIADMIIKENYKTANSNDEKKFNLTKKEKEEESFSKKTDDF